VTTLYVQCQQTLPPSILTRKQHGYMHTLATELANESTDPHIRNAAGLAFKNALAARVSPLAAFQMIRLTATGYR
jgi:hypothetical protein